MNKIELSYVQNPLPSGCAPQDIRYNAIQIAKNFLIRQTRNLARLNWLISYSMKDFKDYLKFENQELIGRIGTF